MIKWLSVLVLVACGSADLEAERDALSEKVSTLETKLERVTQEKEALDARVTMLQSRLSDQKSELQADVERLKEEINTMEKVEIYRRLGIKKGQPLKAVLETTMGSIPCDLFPDQAPKTVLNFVSLAEGGRAWLDPRTREYTDRPLYEGVLFHRVIPGFMIQGGDPLGNGTGGPGYTFVDETDNGLGFDREGLLAMANSGPNTNGSQFFITEGERLPAHLNGRHTVFGACGALDVVKTIARVQSNRRNKPQTDVVIERIAIKR